jgi:hypothetical protein
VGQDQEALGAQAVDDDVGDLLGLEHRARRGHDARGEAHVVGRVIGNGRHGRLDTHRAQAAYAHAPSAVAHRQPFGEGDGRVLGHRVRGRADLREQAGGGGGGQEVSLAALEPARQQRLCGMNVRAEVDVERELPDVSRGGQVGPDGDARVCAEEVDGPEGVLCARDGLVHLCLVRGVAADAQRARPDVGRDSARAIFVEVGEHDAARSVLGEPPRERAPDARCAAGDDGDPVSELHGCHHRVRPDRRALPLPLSARA